MDLSISILCALLMVLTFYHVKKVYFLKLEMNTERECFVKTLNHDLRVATLAQIRALDLLQKKVDSKDIELVRDINDSCKYSLDMITALLNTYRFKCGELILDYEKFKITDIISNSLEKLVHLKSRVEVNCSSDFIIEADKEMITKMLCILISTALSSSDMDKNIKITVETNNTDYLIALSYFGKPLSEEEYRRMFSNKPCYTTVGNGIKMYLCKKIIEFHGGNIHVTNYGKNLNMFTFKIPKTKPSKSSKHRISEAFNGVIF